uniref:hypothetical protein n=1 Tax=Neisseria wadsworthii TaxID=607711 RepID=UPI00131B5A28
MKIEWISLILSLSAIILSFINYRHRVKPSIKIVAVITGFHEDIIVIEMERLVNSIPKLSHSCGLKLSHPMSGVSSGKNHCPSQKYHSNKSGGP